ncbi:MAG: 7-carboxy-7-deazaguanine synthase QueE [Pseudomonadota bacterium]
MFGSNPILPPKKTDGKNLDVQEIFATFQGEGIFTGFPSIFIRLGGCNLACAFCDTEFDSYKNLSLEKILQKTRKLAEKNGKRTHNLVVITGGEPLRQNIVPLCKDLLKEKFQVQIETNGTLYQNLPEQVNIVCSPKNPTGKYYPIRTDLLPKISAFKFLISAQNKNYNFVPEIGQNQYQTPVYLQPIDEYDETKNQKNHQLTLKLAEKNGCRISLQTHKFWGID